MTLSERGSKPLRLVDETGGRMTVRVGGVGGGGGRGSGGRGKREGRGGAMRLMLNKSGVVMMKMERAESIFIVQCPLGRSIVQVQ